jgi:fructose-bisphosphate aldolase class I
MLFSADGLENYISGIIMYDETLKQSTTCNDKIPFTKYLASKGILSGIKVDTGAKELAGFRNEKITEGLDNLRDRLLEYYEIGARFAKWRAVITVGDSIPSDACIYSNAHALARYASLCQENGLVPIVEPEVLMNGFHSIEDCYEISKRTLNTVFEQLMMHHVALDGIILKPNMIISALKCEVQADVNKVADLTFKCLKDNVPSDVPGIAFLSGGQSSDLATAHLNRMNENFMDDVSWNLTFSYGRALQEDALKNWAGKNRIDAQKALIFRAHSNSLATKGLAADMMQKS